MIGQCPECGFDADIPRGPYTQTDEYKLIELWWKRHMSHEPLVSRNVSRILTLLAHALNDGDLWIFHGAITNLIERRNNTVDK